MPDPEPTSEPVARAWRALLPLMRHLPQGALSRAFGRLAELPIPRALRRPILGGYARAFGVDVGEAERPLDAYGTLDAFFVRRLRPGARTWPAADDVAGSPVDGIVGQLGTIQDGRLVQAKGRRYRAADLLGDADTAERFAGGAFLTVYLSPRHYHRIHAPTAGAVVEARYVPGALFPVNTPAVAGIPDLFARNERLVCHLEGPLGRIAVVAVGAYNVGRISADFDPAWSGPGGRPGVTNTGTTRPVHRAYTPPIAIARGAELMAFHLGSTVVLLFEPGRVALEPSLRPGSEIRLGSAIAAAASPPSAA